ncbi:MAG TPA: hypothetical protein P5077_02205 [bacterium]|nr:hypothetical protein [bacterium]
MRIRAGNKPRDPVKVAWGLMKNDLTDLAIEVLEDHLRERADDINALLLLALIHEEIADHRAFSMRAEKNRNQAIESCYRNVLKIDPGNLNALLGMGRRLHPYGECWYLKARKAAPADPQPLLELALLYADRDETGDRDRAHECFRELILRHNRRVFKKHYKEFLLSIGRTPTEALKEIKSINNK